jgi:hypothetical protein
MVSRRVFLGKPGEMHLKMRNILRIYGFALMA